MCAQSFSLFSCSVLSVFVLRKNTDSDTAFSLTSLCRLSLSLYVTLSQIQIVATCLNAQNVPSLPGITPREVEAAWMHVKDMLVVLEMLPIRIAGVRILVLTQTNRNQDLLCPESNGYQLSIQWNPFARWRSS